MPMDIVSTENIASWILLQLEVQSWAAGMFVTVQVSESGDNIAETSKQVPLAVWNETLTTWTSAFGTMGSSGTTAYGQFTITR
jgi:hypothetical protein